MKITYISEKEYSNRDESSGTAYWIPTCLQRADIELDIINVSIPQKLLPPWEELGMRYKQFVSRWSKKGYFTPELLVRRAQYVAQVLEERVSQLNSDVIFTALSPTCAAFLKAKQPIAFWSDYVYSACAGFYPENRFHHIDTRWDGHEVTDACLMNSKLLIFSSHWAARSAIELHGISQNKIHVVPFGPNLEIDHSGQEIKSWVTRRQPKPIKLLFVGKTWFRKGGDIVLAVAKRLNELNHETQVTLVGAKPDHGELPSYVKYIDFISKNSPEDLEVMKRLYQESHFLFVPSRAETFGIVFCEASAFGVPSLTTFVGGIGDVVKNGVNGMTFSLEASLDDICNYILTTLNDPLAYQELCLSSYNEYKTRLNWDVAGQCVKDIIASRFNISC